MFDKGTRTRRVSQRGFTLVELLATLGLMGLIAAIGLPRIASVSTHARLKLLADRVATLDAQCRLWARAGGPVVLLVDSVAHELRVQRERDGEVLMRDALGSDTELRIFVPSAALPVAALRFDALGTSADYSISASLADTSTKLRVLGLSGYVVTETTS